MRPRCPSLCCGVRVQNQARPWGRGSSHPLLTLCIGALPLGQMLAGDREAERDRGGTSRVSGPPGKLDWGNTPEGRTRFPHRAGPHWSARWDSHGRQNEDRGPEALTEVCPRPFLPIALLDCKRSPVRTAPPRPRLGAGEVGTEPPHAHPAFRGRGSAVSSGWTGRHSPSPQTLRFLYVTSMLRGAPHLECQKGQNRLFRLLPESSDSYPYGTGNPINRVKQSVD